MASGALVFALDKAAASHLGAQFQASAVEKRYLALVRGVTEPTLDIVRPLAPKKGAPPVPARTEVQRDWLNEQRTRTLDELYERLREQYDVVIESPATREPAAG